MWGMLHLGAFGFTHQENPKRVITTTRSHITDEVKQAIQAMKPDEVLHVGGAGHKVKTNQSDKVRFLSQI